MSKTKQTAESKKNPAAAFFPALAENFREIGTTFANGDWKTRISYVVMGFGPILRGQVVKGLAFLAAEILFFLYLIPFLER